MIYALLTIAGGYGLVTSYMRKQAINDMSMLAKRVERNLANAETSAFPHVADELMKKVYDDLGLIQATKG